MDFPMCSLIPFHYGFEAAMDHLNRWIRLPQFDIPIAMNTDKNEGQGIFSQLILQEC
jgi:hypothetical protein